MPEAVHWNAERRAVEVGVEIGGPGVVRWCGSQDGSRKLVELAAGSDGERPEIAEAKTFIEVGK